MALLTPEQQAEFSRRRLGLQSDADLNNTRLDQDFGIAQGLLQRQSQQDQTDMGDQMASNGLFQSGIRVNAQGNIIRDYNDNLASLTLQRARGHEDIGRSLSSGLANIDYDQVNALAAATRQEAEAAQQRAQLQALAQQAALKPVQYPNPVIALPHIPVPAIPPAPAPYQWTAADVGASTPMTTQQAIQQLQRTGNYTYFKPQGRVNF